MLTGRGGNLRGLRMGPALLGLEKYKRGAWTPALPTSDGGVLPHTWHYAESGALYQDAAATIPAVADGDVIGASVDQGTDVHTITEAVTAAKPTLKLDIKNGHAVFRCDGGDQLNGVFTAPYTQPDTHFCVAKLDPSVVNNGANLRVVDYTTQRQLYGQSAVQNPDEWYYYAGSSVQTGIAAHSDWTTWTVLFNGASSACWFDGAAANAGDANSASPDGLEVGAMEWVGDIAELLIYDYNLSAADKNEVGQYLATKYGLTWTVIP